MQYCDNSGGLQLEHEAWTLRAPLQTLQGDHGGGGGDLGVGGGGGGDDADHGAGGKGGGDVCGGDDVAN